MMKATLQSAVLLGLLAISLPSFAEVQNVRVGGDITVRAFHRENLDLTDEDGALDDSDDFFMSTVGINVGTDLTENVSAFIRIANERDWGEAEAAPDNENNFGLSQAYITLKELFYSPLTLRLGTQPIVWGRGFVLGSNLIPSVLTIADDRNAAITANEYTDFTAFDAVRATLDLSNLGGMALPLTADYVYIKLDENTAGTSDDVGLQGVNFSTKFDAYNSELEAYYLNKRDKAGATANINKNGTVNTFGVRGSASPVENSLVFAELAYQTGRRATDADTGTGTAAVTGSPFQAWATDLGIEYTLANVATTPKLGFEWVFWSGKDADGSIAGWDPIARGYFTTALRDFQTATAAGFYPTDQAGDTSAATNQSQIGFYGSLKPIEDLTASSRLSFFWQNIGAVAFNEAGTAKSDGERKSFAGTEWDSSFVYNYTEDVQLGLLYAIFWPGSIYHSKNDATAQELVSTVSLKF